MAKCRLREVAEPTILVTKVAKQHDVNSLRHADVLFATSYSWVPVLLSNWIAWIGNSPSAIPKICRDERQLFPTGVKKTAENWGKTRELTAISFTSEEAEAKYGKDKIKAYKTSFTNMYHAFTHRKTSTMMKLVCLLPEEKVRIVDLFIKSSTFLFSRFSLSLIHQPLILCQGNESRCVFNVRAVFNCRS